MGKRIIRWVVSWVKRIMSAVRSIFACGIARLTPEQKAKLEEMEKDYAEFICQRPAGAKVDR